MKKQITKFFLSLIFAGIFSLACLAQAPPQAISYQAVARDNNGNIISNQTVSLRFTVHDATVSGTTVYQETQSATTNVLGLVSLSIGTGTVVSGTFAGINWGSGPKYLQVEIDPAGGTNYTSLGASQMLSVPYALYAANGGGGSTTTGDSVIEVDGTVPLTVSADSFILIPGLSRTVNIPANSKIIVRVTGGILTTSTATYSGGGFFGGGSPSGYSDAVIALFIDGNLPATGTAGYKVIFVTNTDHIYGVFGSYAIDKVYDSSVIGAGPHTFSVQADDIDTAVGSPFIVNSNNSTLQTTMIIEIVKQ